MPHAHRIYTRRVFLVLTLISITGLAVWPSGTFSNTAPRVSTNAGIVDHGSEQIAGTYTNKKAVPAPKAPTSYLLTRRRTAEGIGNITSSNGIELAQAPPQVDALASPISRFAPSPFSTLNDGLGESDNANFFSATIDPLLTGNFTATVTPYVAATPIYEGYFDSAACDRMYGWAWDKNQPNTPINVDIYDGGTFLQTITAGDYRSDLLGNQYHGFNYVAPASIKDGSSHTIHVRFSGTSTELTNSPKSLACAPPAPTITGYSWNTTPTENQPFSGTVSGTGFVSGGTQVFFCVSGTSTCYQHPSAGVIVNSSTSLSLINVNLSGGSWQFYVQNSSGQSARSASFTVQTAVPTITGYSWSTTPTSNQPFGGSISGTGFASGIRVFFCVNGTSTCYEQPSAGIIVNSSTSLSLINVNLGSGSYQIYVQTSAGQSARSTAFNVQAALPTITGYTWNTTPTANQPFGGTITGTGFVSGGTQVYFCVNGTSTCYQHPSAGVTVNSSTSLSVVNVIADSGSYQIYVQTSAGQSARSSAFTVQVAPAPTITGYSWNTTPIANQPFSGTITGTNFISGIRVFFCVAGTSTCYEHPSAGITVNSPTSLSVVNVNAGSGSYEIYVQTSAGQSARSAPFTVQASPAPTITGYSWSTTPTANQPFGGTITGTGFAAGIRVFFCVAGTSTCYEHPSAGITVNSSTSLTLINVNVGSGSYQIYVQTSAGQSALSSAFTVQAAPAPTITGFSWNTTPIANQPFGGTITGTNFVSGIRVFFCVAGTSTCYEHPSAGIIVNSSTSLSLINVNAGSGSYEIYVQTSAGQSARSAPFTVQASTVPTITGYSWNATPIANQPFGGTITGTNFISGIRVFFCVAGTNTCYEHPSAGVILNSPTSLSVVNVNAGSGTYEIYVQTSAGQSPRSAPFSVQTAPTAPTVSGYSWNTTPTANQPFSGTVTGIGFASDTQVWFCVTGTAICYQQPSAGVTVNNSSSLTVSNVNLGGGSWQIYVQTSAGQSARSAAFNVQTVVPTITKYSWSTAPTASQPFNGMVTGTNFIPGIRVFFCINGSTTCYEQPSAGITVNSSTSLSLSNINLDSGLWQLYLQTSAGQSARSAAFKVDLAPLPTPTSQKRPLIFIPGIAGSKLNRTSDNFAVWPNTPGYYEDMTLDPAKQGFSVFPSDVIRYKDGFYSLDVYGQLLDNLKDPTRGNYTEYHVQDSTGVFHPERRTTNGCDYENQRDNHPNLFVFAYDWRISNIQNAYRLQDYVGCIRKFYPDPNTKIDILTHSMGGLVARRYMLTSKDQTIGKFITIASPWLGAPKAINVLEQGVFLDKWYQQLMTNGTFMTLSEFYPAVHELLPSRQYFNLVNNPLSFRGTPVNDYNEFAYIMNQRYPRSYPGHTNSIFHDAAGQDDERVGPSAEEYFHFVGNGLIKNTITAVNIVSQCSRETPPSKCASKYELTLGVGDGTVPLGSAKRGYGTSSDLNAAGANVRVFPGGDEVGHTPLVSNQNVIVAVLRALGAIPPASAGLNNQSVTQAKSGGSSEVLSSQAGEELPTQLAYYVELTGTNSVTITDETGNATNPFSQPADAGLPNVTSYITGPASAETVVPLDQTYTVTWRAGNDPLQLSITREAQLPDSAIRYLDLQLSAGVMCMVKLTPLGVDGLRCDKDGDGTFETLISPSASVSGTDAQDKTAPSVTISSAPQSNTLIVSVSAQDSGSGVKAIYYSVNGANFAQYTAPFTVDPLSAPVVYAFADDNAANRSSLITYYPSSTGNQIDNSQFFVRQHYLDFLGREPDSSGLAFWTSGMTSCGADAQCAEVKRINTSAAFFLSIEFQDTGYLVYRTYKAAFGNIPNKPVPVTRELLLPDTQEIGNGVVVNQGNWQQQLETNKQTYFNEFVTRAQFTALYPTTMTPEQYVDALNANAGTILSQSERDGLVNDLKAGAKTRAQVLRSVAENQKLASAEFNKAFVLMQYYGYLRRNPDDLPDHDFSGWQFWLSKLNQFNGNYINAEMVKAFITSIEYGQRFGQ